jgi:hypothetical protein
MRGGVEEREEEEVDIDMTPDDVNGVKEEPVPICEKEDVDVGSNDGAEDVVERTDGVGDGRPDALVFAETLTVSVDATSLRSVFASSSDSSTNTLDKDSTAFFTATAFFATETFLLGTIAFGLTGCAGTTTTVVSPTTVALFNFGFGGGGGRATAFDFAASFILPETETKKSKRF